VIPKVGSKESSRTLAPRLHHDAREAIEVTNSFTETFWSKQGFNWFAGI